VNAGLSGDGIDATRFGGDHEFLAILGQANEGAAEHDGN
jgi:hypothetical protein